MDISKGQVVAAGRHLLTFVAGGITVAASLHAITPTDATNATAALNQIGTGIASVIAGVTTLIGVASGAYAAWSASPFSQIFAVKKLAETPTGTVVGAQISRSAQVALVNAAAAVPGTEKIVNPTLALDPATANNVVNK